MTTATERPGSGTATGLRRDGERLWPFLRRELAPRGKWLTPFNVVSLAIMATAAVILVVRFTFGLGSVTNLSQEFPWGIWKGFNVVTGVAFAGGAYVLTFMVYVLRMEKYRPIVRVTVLNGFLAYTFYAVALLLELGRPWKIMNPIIGHEFGLTSVLFLIAWHFLLYIIAQLLEFLPATAEWLNLRKVHRALSWMTVGTVIFGITLSTLHQSALGALFLMAEPKIHPLWYSELIPTLFFISSIFAGLSLVILEGSLSHRVFRDRMGAPLKRGHDDILIGLGRIAGAAMFVYLFLELLKLLHGGLFGQIQGPWGAWYVVEIGVFTAIPMALFLWASSRRDLRWIQVGAGMTLVGIVLNRLNISLIAFKWYAPVHYVPTWMEVVVAAAVICAEVWVFRWVIERMPVLGGEPAWAEHHEAHGRAAAPAAAPRAVPQPITARSTAGTVQN
jgi:Ni/Fe-hydrogenase subunit HybB-like protein